MITCKAVALTPVFLGRRGREGGRKRERERERKLYIVWVTAATQNLSIEKTRGGYLINMFNAPD